MPPRNKRKIVAAIPVSVDGSTEGSFGETEWIESWADAGDLICDVDAFVGGATLIAAMLDAGLVDELRLIAHPIVLGRGSGMCDPACHVGSQSSNTQV